VQNGKNRTFSCIAAK